MNTGKQLVSKPSFDAGFGVGFNAGYEAGFVAAMKLFGNYLPPASPVMERTRPAPKPRLDGAAFADVMYKATTVTDAQREEAQALAEIRAARRRASKGHIDPKAAAQIERLKAAGYVVDPQCPPGQSNPMPGVGVPYPKPEPEPKDIPTPSPSPLREEGKERTPPLAPPLTKGGERGQKYVSRKGSGMEKNAPGGVSKAFDPDGKGKILIIPAGDPASFEAVQAKRYEEVEQQDLQARTQATIDEKNAELRRMYEERKAARRQEKQQRQEKVAQ